MEYDLHDAMDAGVGDPFLAAAQVPGGVVKSNALFVIFGSTVIGVASLLVLSTCGTWVDPDTGIAGLPSFRMAGWISWVILLAGMITVYMLTRTFKRSIMTG